MGLLDGDLARAMGGVFGGIYLDALMHRSIITHDGQGGGTETFEDPEACKAQLDEQREMLYEGNTERFQIILLLKYVNGQPIERPSDDDEISLGGGRYAISMVMADPAEAYFELACRAADTEST